MFPLTEIERQNRDEAKRQAAAKMEKDLRAKVPITPERLEEIRRDLVLINDPSYYPPVNAHLLCFNYAIELSQALEAHNESVRRAVEAEREACAQIAADIATRALEEVSFPCDREQVTYQSGKRIGADEVASTIRARGEEEKR